MGRFNKAQRELIRAQPQAAVDRLSAAGVTDADWLQAVLQHPERRNSAEPIYAIKLRVL
jgi:hypothetical protein